MAEAGSARAVADRVRENVERVIVVRRDAIDLALAALLCEGHVLIEDVPGIGKTMLAKSIARSLGCSFRRIQCTPDLLPSDITGLTFFNQRAQTFEFRQGPIFAQVILADEINRATPRTQSALLEAMEERQVTTEDEVRLLPRPFLVLATQNPVELQGTFPLPEAQLDRFLLRIRIGYPDRDGEREILRRFQHHNPLDDLQPVTSPQELLALAGEVRAIHVSPAVEEYVVAIAAATRHHPEIELGASPRGSLALFRTAQAWAALRGRAFVIPDDVKRLAPYALSHRIIATAQSRLRERGTVEIIDEVVATVPAPVEAV